MEGKLSNKQKKNKLPAMDTLGLLSAFYFWDFFLPQQELIAPQPNCLEPSTLWNLCY